MFFGIRYEHSDHNSQMAERYARRLEELVSFGICEFESRSVHHMGE